MRLGLTALFILVFGTAATNCAAEDMTSGGLTPPPALRRSRGLPQQITLRPIYKQRHFCSEHTASSWDLGDSLGTDCLVVSSWGNGYPRFYRSDGKSNEDWYGWHVDVLAPVKGRVVGTYNNNIENTPGVFGKKQASAIQIMAAHNKLVILVHVTEIKVKKGDLVTVGEVLARVGNNGIADAPHIHVGAYDAKRSLPLQIRWNLAEQAQISGDH